MMRCDDVDLLRLCSQRTTGKRGDAARPL